MLKYGKSPCLASRIKSAEHTGCPNIIHAGGGGGRVIVYIVWLIDHYYNMFMIHWQCLLLFIVLHCVIDHCYHIYTILLSQLLYFWCVCFYVNVWQWLLKISVFRRLDYPANTKIKSIHTFFCPLVLHSPQSLHIMTRRVYSRLGMYHEYYYYNGNDRS